MAGKVGNREIRPPDLDSRLWTLDSRLSGSRLEPDAGGCAIACIRLAGDGTSGPCGVCYCWGVVPSGVVVPGETPGGIAPVPALAIAPAPALAAAPVPAPGRGPVIACLRPCW